MGAAKWCGMMGLLLFCFWACEDKSGEGSKSNKAELIVQGAGGPELPEEVAGIEAYWGKTAQEARTVLKPFEDPKVEAFYASEKFTFVNYSLILDGYGDEAAQVLGLRVTAVDKADVLPGVMASKWGQGQVVEEHGRTWVHYTHPEKKLLVKVEHKWTRGKSSKNYVTIEYTYDFGDED